MSNILIKMIKKCLLIKWINHLYVLMIALVMMVFTSDGNTLMEVKLKLYKVLINHW